MGGLTSLGFRENTANAVLNRSLRQALPTATDTFTTMRAQVVASLPMEAWRDNASAIRMQVLGDLPAHLDRLSANATRAGAVVHRVKGIETARDIVFNILKDHGARKVVKSKSMVTEEIHLNAYLEARGMEVVETCVAAFFPFQSAPAVMESVPRFSNNINMNYLINQVLSGNTVSKGSWAAFIWKPICLIAVLVAVGCASVPHTGRRQLNMVSDQQLRALALKAFNEVVAKEPPCKDRRLNEIVRKVTDRVSKAAEMIDKPKFDWEVRVIDRDVPNAFCLPGGKIVVCTGMVSYARNEAGLAAVIAHETAHAVARHSGERLSQQLALKGVMTVGGEVLKNDDGSLNTKARVLLGALGMGGTVGIMLPYSRLHEFEADRIGQLYMAAAGYDPSEAGRLWDRMAKIKKPPIPIWLSTHPADEERVRKLSESLPEAQKLYAQAPTKYGVGAPL